MHTELAHVLMVGGFFTAAMATIWFVGRVIYRDQTRP